jgi:GrpB-like predicted nucleotidyltransferase (UPF0157 family)
MRRQLGLARGTVVLVPYDDEWPALFRAEADRIARVDGLAGLHLEHMGSTAVPGLCAKPIIDILAGHPAGAPPKVYIDALVSLGYMYRGEQEIPGRHFFRRGELRTHHAHLAEIDGVFWRDHLAFRDALRAEPSFRDAYATLKQELAARFPNDREAYIEGKGPFVHEVLLAHPFPAKGQ